MSKKKGEQTRTDWIGRPDFSRKCWQPVRVRHRECHREKTQQLIQFVTFLHYGPRCIMHAALKCRCKWVNTGTKKGTKGKQGSSSPQPAERHTHNNPKLSHFPVERTFFPRWIPRLLSLSLSLFHRGKKSLEWQSRWLGMFHSRHFRPIGEWRNNILWWKWGDFLM